METSLNTDVRNPKRKVAWTSDNMETLFGMLPAARRGGGKVVSRDEHPALLAERNILGRVGRCLGGGGGGAGG
jgi:hypothetical protein